MTAPLTPDDLDLDMWRKVAQTCPEGLVVEDIIPLLVDEVWRCRAVIQAVTDLCDQAESDDWGQPA